MGFHISFTTHVITHRSRIATAGFLKVGICGECNAIATRKRTIEKTFPSISINMTSGEASTAMKGNP